MVCQRLALIMGFVSVCLRKWHARAHRRVCAPSEHMLVGERIYCTAARARARR